MAKKVKRKDQNQVLAIRGLVKPETFNKDKRTIDVVFATDAPVLRYDYSEGEYFDEVLSFDAGNVRLDRINAGGPVLNSHDSYDLSNVLGVVVKAWIENGQGRATLMFSDRDEVAGTIRDIENGIVKNVSVGYRVLKYEKTEASGENTRAVKRATDWEPYEISMVPIPADFKSTTRSLKKPINKNLNTRDMPKPTLTPEQKEAKKKEQREKRAAELKAAGSEAQTKERARVKLITEAVRKAGIEKPEFLEKLIVDGTSVSKARQAIINHMAKEDKGVRGSHAAVTGTDEKDKLARSMSDSILLRAMPSFFTGENKAAEGANEYRGMSLLDLAREACEKSGINTRGMSKREVARAALFGVDSMGRAYMSVSDFPIILGNTINRTLRAAYELAPRTFMPFTRQVSAADFRAMTRVQMGDISDFDKISEGQEYKRGSFGEAKESYAVEKFGKIIPLTWEALVNDDLSAFSRIPQMIAEAAAQKQSDIVWGILIDNAAMADGTALFHANHGNLGTPGALGLTTMAEGRKLLRKQTSIGGRFLNLTASYLLVAPEKEQDAFIYTSKNYVPTEPAKINPEFNTSLKPIVEPRLSALNNGLAHFFVADPSRIDTIEYAFLEGDGELFTEQRTGFDVDGLEVKARMVFGAKAIDWRGMVKNLGA